MPAETRTTDAKARITLPRAFANSTVLMEQVSENEVRIRKARVIPEDEARFMEETPTVLSQRDAVALARMLENPPKANAALRRAIHSYKRRSHG